MMQVSLKAARVNAGMSQKEAAKMIGVSNKTLCNWEKGVSYPSADKILNICQTYKVSYDNISWQS